jgi:serine/threonine-protein kinase HipA
VVNAQLKLVHYDPVVVMPRFDRQPNGRRWHYIRATSLLQAPGEQTIDYLELLEAMRQHCKDFTADARELWRRLVFRCLINQSETDLSKIDFLYVGKSQWTLAPAYDLTPALPDGSADQQEGPRLTGLDDLQLLMRAAEDFQMDTAHAMELLAQLVRILGGWTSLASTFPVGMSPNEIQQLRPVFDNAHMRRAKLWLKDRTSS